MTRNSLPICALLLLACGCSGGGGTDADAATDAAADTGAPDSGTPDGAIADSGGEEDAGSGAAGMAFFLAPDRRDLPVPFDFFTVSDPATPTGLRVKMGDSYNKPFSVGLNFLGAKYPKAIDMNDGWSPLAPHVITVLKRIDASQLSRTDDFTGADAPIWLFAVPAAGDEVVREKITAEYREDILGDGTRQRYLSVRPRLPLSPKTKYALLFTSAFKTALGGALEPTDDFKAVRDGTGNGPDYEKAAALIGPVVSLLTATPTSMPRDGIALMSVFTTMSIVDDYETIDTMMESGTVKAPAANFDPDGDSRPNVSVPSSPASASLAVTGTFNSPRFTDVHGIFVYDAAGRPAVQKDDNLEFILLLPKTGTQPFKTCIFQHGLGSDKNAVYSHAIPLLEQGVAVIAIDAVTHGSRSPDPGGASLQFLNISEPATSRDNFRQTVVDHMQLARFVQSLATMDFYPPDGQGNPAGDQTPDLDVSDLCYVGNSLGSIIGGSTLGVTKQIGAGVLNVGGGTLMDFVETFIADKIPTLKDSPEIPLYAVAVQHILDKGDPTNIGHYVTKEPRPFVGRTKQVLMQEAINDGTVPNVTTEHLARALDVPLLRPFVKEVWGLEQKDAPAEKLGLFQYDPANHNLISEDGDDPIGKNGARARAQMAEFVRSYFATGTAVIINPPAE